MNWETDGKGNVIARPLLGHETATAYGAICLVRLRYAARQPDMKVGLRDLQLSMTPQQAQELADSLLKLAAKATRPPEIGNA